MQISEKVVGALPVPGKGNKVHFFSGATLQGKKAPAGFGVRVTTSGARSFVLFHRHGGRKFLETLGRWDENEKGGSLTVRDAIVKADKLVKALGSGKRQDPRPDRTRRQQDGHKPEGLTVSGMLDLFVSRYVRQEKNLRSAGEIERTFRQLVRPAIGHLGIYEVKRSHVTAMLDEIADGKAGKDHNDGGPVMADRAFACFRKACNWYAARDEEFTPPIVKGMRSGAAQTRDRVLADDEIRDLWAALENVEGVPACYPRFVKFLMLTATRRDEAADMHSVEVDGDIWVIPASRYKSKVDHTIPLSAAAKALIGSKPEGRKGNGRYVFSTTDGVKPFSGFSKAKLALDKAIAAIREREGREPMANWTLHDLRRTARTLLSRAKVPADHAERCLGHVIGGVRGVYDRHGFLDEKRCAFGALAAIVNDIRSA